MIDRGQASGTLPNACPFLALEEDRDRRSPVPDGRHRCYAEALPQPRALTYQESYCLGPAFSSCRSFLDWAARAAAEPVVHEARAGVPAPAALAPVPAEPASLAAPPPPPRPDTALAPTKGSRLPPPPAGYAAPAAWQPPAAHAPGSRGIHVGHAATVGRGAGAQNHRCVARHRPPATRSGAPWMAQQRSRTESGPTAAPTEPGASDGRPIRHGARRRRSPGPSRRDGTSGSSRPPRRAEPRPRHRGRETGGHPRGRPARTAMTGARPRIVTTPAWDAGPVAIPVGDGPSEAPAAAGRPDALDTWPAVEPDAAAHRTAIPGRRAAAGVAVARRGRRRTGAAPAACLSLAAVVPVSGRRPTRPCAGTVPRPRRSGPGPSSRSSAVPPRWRATLPGPPTAAPPAGSMTTLSARAEPG